MKSRVFRVGFAKLRNTIRDVLLPRQAAVCYPSACLIGLYLLIGRGDGAFWGSGRAGARPSRQESAELMAENCGSAGASPSRSKLNCSFHNRYDVAL